MTSIGDKTILVTGAAGFIGYHVCTRLLADGARVVGLDNLNDYYDVSLKTDRLGQIGPHKNFSFERMDIVDAKSVADLVGRLRPDVIIHLAAQAGVRHSLVDPHSYVRANVDGFLSVLEAARTYPVRHLIYASSSSVYGSGARVPFHEEDPALSPVSLYAATKRANELMAEAYANLYAIPSSGLRFFTVYGPWGRPDMAYFTFTKSILEGRPIDVFNHGQLRRDFTYIDDIVEAIVRLIDKPPTARRDPNRPPHTLYNIGSHAPVELGRFIATIEEKVGRPAEKRYVSMQPGDVVDTFADVARLAAATGFKPMITLDIGLGRFVEWYRHYYNVY
jgi:UDP-glucuronate 4-epimerase